MTIENMIERQCATKIVETATADNMQDALRQVNQDIRTLAKNGIVASVNATVDASGKVTATKTIQCPYKKGVFGQEGFCLATKLGLPELPCEKAEVDAFGDE